MTFEFLIACRLSAETDLTRVLAELLFRALQDNLNEFDEAEVGRMLQLRYQREGHESPADDGTVSRHLLAGLTIELPEEVESAETVIDDFAAVLPETPPIFHALKFEDPILKALLAQKASEIFALEMKLRRVLSVIYLHNYQDGDPYNLLVDERTQPVGKQPPSANQMREHAENQFFYLTFSQYVGLNQRVDIKLPALVQVLQSSSDYDVFRAEIMRTPVPHEDDAGLLAGLKERMEAIESMRNCVAHNRWPSERCSQNYDTALPLLENLLDQYLARWRY